MTRFKTGGSSSWLLVVCCNIALALLQYNGISHYALGFSLLPNTRTTLTRNTRNSSPSKLFSSITASTATTATTPTTNTEGFQSVSEPSSSVPAAEEEPVIDTEWSMIESIPVQTLDNQTMILGDLVQQYDDKTFILTCLSHFGDLGAWEMTQQYVAAIKSEKIPTDSPIVLIGIGSVKAAQEFATSLELETYSNKLTLVADETGAVTEALGCYQGWLSVDKRHKEEYPFTDINPYFKMFGMMMGMGSQGTLSRIMYGYKGDVGNCYGPEGREWVIDALKQGTQMGRKPAFLDSSSTAAFESTAISEENIPLQPKELSTLRLQNGRYILSKFNKLAPEDKDLITRQGGTFVFSKNNKNNNNIECIWEYFDKGILLYTNVEDVCNIADAARRGKDRYIPPIGNETQAQLDRVRLRNEREEEQRRIEQARRDEEFRLEVERMERQQALQAKIAAETREAQMAQSSSMSEEQLLLYGCRVSILKMTPREYFVYYVPPLEPGTRIPNMQQRRVLGKFSSKPTQYQIKEKLEAKLKEVEQVLMV